MTSQADLLDELARVYARAAVEEFIAASRTQEFPPCETSAPTDGNECKLAGKPTRLPIGSDP